MKMESRYALLLLAVCAALAGITACAFFGDFFGESSDARPCPDCQPCGPDCGPQSADWRDAPRGASWSDAARAGADNPYGLPPMQLPAQMRERNYSGGSCVHASMEMCLRWQGYEELADWWRQKYHGGEHASGLIAKAEAAGLKFAATTAGDAGFLDWASRTRRGAVIFYKPSHSIVFCGYDGETAVLLDNNHIADFERVPKATFVQRWKGFGGFALTPVATPRPPKMWALAAPIKSTTNPAPARSAPADALAGGGCRDGQCARTSSRLKTAAKKPAAKKPAAKKPATKAAAQPRAKKSMPAPTCCRRTCRRCCCCCCIRPHIFRRLR